MNVIILMTLATRLATFDADSVQKDSFAATVDSAFERVERVLKSNSEGARFFGPYALEALTAMKGTIKIAGSSDLYIGIKQVYDQNSKVVGEFNSEGAFVRRYRVPSQTIFYTSGPFFHGLGGRIGSYPGGTPQAQTLALLHELAHNIAREGGGYLIPDDGPTKVDGQVKSHHSTAMIERLLRDQIWRRY